MLRILGLFGSHGPLALPNAQSSQSHGHWLTIPIGIAGIALTNINIHESDTKNTNELLDGEASGSQSYHCGIPVDR